MHDRRRHSLLFGGLLAALPLAAGATAPEAEQEPRVYGGEPTQDCQWPTTVYLGGCTGTLVHEQVVIYAAHCGGSVGQVRFGENGDAPNHTVATKWCKINPAYNQPGPLDQAVCVLQEPVDAPIVPPLMGCEAQILQPGKNVVIAGYGWAGPNGPFGIKHWVETPITGVSGDVATIGGGGKDACNGDSGGPVFVQLTTQDGGDDTWRAFGITSYGPQHPNCGAGGGFAMMHTQMEWIESELAGENLDITPCHDADGTWNPGPTCFGFPQDPGTPYSGWSDWCEGGPRGAWSSICGDPFNDEPDDAAPSVVITAPEQQQVFDTMGEGSAMVPVSVSADDMDGWGVKQVDLLVDDEVIEGATVFQAPYEWTNLQFPPGQYKIGAVAEDYAGNVGVAEDIYIGVDMDAEEPPDDDDDDTGGTGTDDGPDGDGTGPMGEGDSGEDDGGKGCGCTTASTGGAGWGLLGLLGLVVFRRRRR